jgi:hypothetical protein
MSRSFDTEVRPALLESDARSRPTSTSAAIAKDSVSTSSSVGAAGVA